MRTKAIVIKKQQANEYDQIVTLYSEDYGTMRAMARGVCKPTSVQSMHLELLNTVEFEVIHGKSMPIISSAVMSHQHLNIKESLPKLVAVQFFTEVLDKIAFENEKDAHLWEFLNTMLVDFDDVSSDGILPLFRKHQAGFLKVLGYAPQIERCVVCSTDPMVGTERMIALSTELGGVMCADCFLAGGQGVLLEKNDLNSLIGTSLAPATKHSTLDTFFEYTVGRKISSLGFLYQVIK
ncbi:MAG: DNA repair protein RecO [Candidatus Yanofskybacteria bacterium RIFCSPHIGHO2_01_FULL_41_21]|uniref:DNA repair protein RecO n=2 Tax=Candidatus Yanofskyibacteriota TaxID=1752733 RepID=A0A0G0WIQ1_9BACT|nr:MAG: repair protein RecO protein [Candidatus Yanofskybacteria bacterium GW2011_GWA1_41_6]OGM97639.1 MAG: DNA repair protein RecO [Candidatus Yanofskybacteria bacterium RIFCSPHIGHO2_01_FULL_41_21]